MKERLGRKLLSARERIDRRRLGDTPFCIISDDCWGARLYRHLGRRYNTPFVGLGMRPPEYVRFVSDLRRYLEMPLVFEGQMREHPGEEPYPAGQLGDLSVGLKHYRDPYEACEKWRRRVERIDFDHLFVKFGAGRPETTPELLRQFLAAPPPNKLVLAREPVEGCVAVDWCADAEELFVRSQQVFDATGWLLGEGVKQPTLSQRVIFSLADGGGVPAEPGPELVQGFGTVPASA